MKIYRMKKSLLVFRRTFHLYKQKQKSLVDSEKKEIREILNALQEEILRRDRKKASHFAHLAENWAKTHMPKTPLEKGRDFIFALAFALFVAILVRSIWFELYEIPTGSMRPTLQEKDRLVVSKTVFGINIPLYKGHLFFNPELVKRSNILIFTGRNMDISDVNTMYFYLFPGKKQFVKRLIGKPEDTLYFYGGQIYGIDKSGKDLTDELQPPILSKIDHVPYIYFNGRVDLPSKSKGSFYSPAILRQMNQKVAHLSINPLNKIEGKLLPPYENQVKDYFDLWGFKTYGIARILTKAQVLALTETPESQLEEAPLYMEIFHHPSVKNPTIHRNRDGRLFPGVGTSQAILPLNMSHIKTLFNHLYTARFIVKEGYATPYGSSIKPGKKSNFAVPLKGVPDGTYEFYYGKAYQVDFGGITRKLPSDHPLCTFTPRRLQLLFNLGMEWLTPFEPQSKMPSLLPSRYVYYRFGDLYALGTILMKKDDPFLTHFIQKEYLKQQNAPSYRPYYPFDDFPPPFKKDGKIDPAFVNQYGITVPKNHYLVLGDNYARSADSRDFGFVPEANIRGAPSLIFWPPGKRWGAPLQLPYPLINFPRAAIWILFSIILIFYWMRRRKYKLPFKIE